MMKLQKDEIEAVFHCSPVQTSSERQHVLGMLRETHGMYEKTDARNVEKTNSPDPYITIFRLVAAFEKAGGAVKPRDARAVRDIRDTWQRSALYHGILKREHSGGVLHVVPNMENKWAREIFSPPAPKQGR